MTYDFGQIILVSFPFTDLSREKRRPAVVVSNAAYNQIRPDIVLMAITSQLRESLGYGEYIITEWRAAGLPKPSVVKPIFGTFVKHKIIRNFGRLSIQHQEGIRMTIRNSIG